MKQTAHPKAKSTQNSPSNSPQKSAQKRGFFSRSAHHYQTLIPPYESVLHIGCTDGSLLNIVQPSFGVGIDTEQAVQKSQATYPEFNFYSTLEQIPITHQFDYIFISTLASHSYNIPHTLRALHPYCHAGTRIIIETDSYVWAAIKRAGSQMFRRSFKASHRFLQSELLHFGYLAEFGTVTRFRHTLIPSSILPVRLCNMLWAQLPFLNTLCAYQSVVLRPAQHPVKKAPRVSVIIPCKNEAGNIERAVQECPALGDWMEIIFIEGHSSDNTVDEIKRVIAAYPEKNIRYFVQPNRGKADAVRLGFQHAQGDVLIILDGDLTVAPQTLPEFLNALTSGKGEFINGSRLVYGMEKEAMMLTAWWANHFFARLLSLIMRQRITDSLCGTKVLWKKDYQRIAAHRSFFGMYDPFGDFDLLFGAARLQLKIIDIPIRYKARTYGTSAINRIKDVWFLLWMSARAWWFLKR